MPRGRKDEQLQIRVSAAQKAALRRNARRAGMSMSDFVLSKVLPPLGERFQALLAALAVDSQPGYALAALNDFLTPLSASELELAVAEAPPSRLEPYWANYVAAMVEQASARRDIPPPSWTRDVPPLDEPVFGSDLVSLRLHLLTRAPIPFRRRNLFVDSGIGGRV